MLVAPAAMPRSKPRSKSAITRAIVACPSWAGPTVTRDVVREVAELKRQPGAPIHVLGSSQLVHTLVDHDLADEYQLWLHPVVRSEGNELFP